MKYAKESPEPTEVAKALNVESVFGKEPTSVLSDVIRVTVQLIDARPPATRSGRNATICTAPTSWTFEDQIAADAVGGQSQKMSS